MEDFGDNTNALFCDPNAYLQKYDSCPKCDANNKDRCKIVFQEPYECMPSFHLDNNFKKTDKSCNHHNHDKDCDCNKNNNHNNSQSNSPMFDIKNLMPMLSALTGGANTNSLGGLLNMLGGKENSMSNILSNLTGGNNNISTLLNGLNLFNNSKKKSTKNQEIISTENDIKNYTRVE